MADERILILEDDAGFARSLSEMLSTFGVTRSTSYPERMPEIMEEFNPTLLIVDYNLNHPTLNGIKATRLLRKRSASNLVPVLLLSGEDDMGVIEEAFKSGIDDYVLKPVQPRYLLAKIENLLFQSRKKLNAQALSGLPGNAAIETEFYLRLQSRKSFSVAYADLDHFKPFNDEKGVKKGDEAIRCVAEILYSMRGETAREQLFVGHIGGDDFFLMGSKTVIQKSVKKLHRVFEDQVKSFFTEDELNRGSYRGTDRQGRICSFPLLTISTAILEGIEASAVRDFQSMTQWAAAAKKQAKKSAARIFAVSAAGLPLPKAESDLFSQVEEGAKKVSLKRRRK